MNDHIWDLIAKWRCEASEFGDRYRSQVGYNIDAEDSGREWALNKVADELQSIIEPKSHLIGDKEDAWKSVWAALMDAAPDGWEKYSPRGADSAVNAIYAMSANSSIQPYNGYIEAFYKLAEMLEIGAQTESPMQVWEDRIIPKIERLISDGRLLEFDAIAYVEGGAPWEDDELVWEVSNGSGRSYRPLFAGEKFHEPLEVSEEGRKESRSNWLPIDTAPTDGTIYLASDGESRWIENRPDGHKPGFYEAKDFGWYGLPCDRTATCWQPLAEIPEKA